MKNETTLRNHNNTDNQMIYMYIVQIHLYQKIKYTLKSHKKMLYIYQNNAISWCKKCLFL